MATLVQTKIGESRGVARLWIEGKRLAREGFAAGQRLRMAIEDGYLTLRVLEEQEAGHSIRISQRKASNWPLFEIRDKVLETLFGAGSRVVVKFARGKLHIGKHHLDEKRRTREAALVERLAAGEPLRFASLYHGGGVMDSAIHEGLADAGIDSYCRIVNELEPAYLESSLRNNPQLFRRDTLVLNAPIEQLDFSLPHALTVDALVGGIPCTGASKSGKARNKIVHAEEHTSAGAQFFAFLRMCERLNPALVVLENVADYRNTASYAVVLSVLQTMGYRVTERILGGNEFGALDMRKRLVMVAVSEGLEAFDIEGVEPLAVKPATIAEALDDPADVADLWKDYQGLREKEARDLAAGKNFRRTVLTPDAEAVPTLTRGYQRARSTEAQLAHPTDPLLSRLFTRFEHARFKGVPLRIIEGLSSTVAHEVLGQGVIYPVFQAVGRAIGRWLAAMIPAKATAALVA
jgi:DNA (cytosine-5)-methyltransferase 1